jgi:hypothetical protein
MRRPDRQGGDPLRTSLSGIVSLLALFSATGCTAMHHTKAMDSERALSASGFQIQLARTPEQTAQVERLPQRKLVRVPFEGGVRYVYADAEFCRCIYAGTENAFKRYRSTVAADIRREELASSMVLAAPVDAGTVERDATLATKMILDPSADASLDWASWGPWGPWY